MNMGIHLSLRTRLLIAFLSLSLLVLAASGAGYFFAHTVNETISSTESGLAQLQVVNDLQKDWQLISESIDNLFQTRQVDRAIVSLNVRLDLFKSRLEGLQNQSFGLYGNTVATNESILNELQISGTEMRTTIDEVIRLASEDRWAVARDMRETVLAGQQTTFNDGLRQLTVNIRNDVQKSFSEALYTQNLTRTITLVTAISALFFAIILSIAATGSIFKPISQLTEAVQRVTLRDFSAITPLSRKDEIGNLSRSFSLMTEWLRDSYDSLEERISDRTQELERQNLQIQVAAEIARDVSSSRNTEELLKRGADLIVQRFGYYHSGIFLIDETNEFAVLRAASGPAGQEMISTGHKLKIGQVGIVGHVAMSGNPRIALEVEQDQTYFDNPMLPETRSEIALPMKVGSQVIGVLDVQSRNADAFNDSDMNVLQILADLLAVAIQNAQLNQEIEENLNELEILYGQYSRETWQKVNTSRNVIGYRYDSSGLHKISADHLDGADSVGPDPAPADIQLKVRGQLIGSLQVWPGENRLLAEDIKFLEDLAMRISQSMDSAQLFYETQRRAENERIVRQISSQMRETLEVESVLRTAAEDIYQALNLSELSIQLTPQNIEPADDSHGDLSR